MASFTDNPQLLTNFTPYREQVPVEELGKAKLYKQQLYEQGYQRIQSAIDNVAGLPIIKDVDKAYFQSKMNSLGNSLKLVAAGDFSDFQLVNSVGGMVNQVGKDPNILNAVASTENHRAQLQAINKAKEEGKWGIENEADYLKNFDAYMSSNKVGERFSASYTPYIDVNKKLYDIAKEVGVDESIIPELFQTDESGKIKRDEKTGVPIFNPVMAEKHLKGKDPAKLLDAFKNGLTPADYNQLAITGRYINSGKSPDDLAQEVIAGYSNDIELSNSKLKDLNISLYKEKSKPTPNPEKVKSIEDQITYFKNQRENLRSTIEEDARDAYTNPEKAMARLYTNNYISSMSKDLSEITEETKYSVNPHHTVDMDLRNFGLNQQRFTESVRQWEYEQGRKEYWNQKEYDAKYNIQGQTGTEKPLDIKGISAIDILNQKQDEYNAGIENLYETNRKLVVEWYKKAGIVKAINGESKEEWEDRIMRQIYSEAKSKGIDATANSKDMFDYISAQAAQHVTDWKTAKDDDNLYQFKGLMDTRDKLSKELLVQRALIENRHGEALRQATKEGIDVNKHDLSNIGEISIPISGEPSIKLSKQDVVDFIKSDPSMFKTFKGLSSLFDTAETQREQQRSNERLMAKYGKYYPTIRQHLFPTYPYAGRTYPIKEIDEASKIVFNKDIQRIAEIEAGIYQKEGDLERGQIFEVKKGKTDIIDYTGNIVSAIRAMGGLSGISGSDSEEMLRKVIDKSSSISIDADPTNEGINYTLVVTDENGEEHKGLTTPATFAKLTGNQPLTKVTKPMVLEMIDRWGTTSQSVNFDPQTAWFSSEDFTQLQGSEYSAVGNLVEDPNNSDNLIFEIYINGSDTPIQARVPISKYSSPGVYNQQLDDIASAITPANIKNLLKK